LKIAKEVMNGRASHHVSKREGRRCDVRFGFVMLGRAGHQHDCFYVHSAPPEETSLPGAAARTSVFPFRLTTG